MFICVVVALVGLIGADDYFHLGELPARVWAVALGLAAFLAVSFIGGHFWPKLRLILYGAVLGAGAILGVASGDEKVIGALGGLALLGVFLACVYFFLNISSAKLMWAVPAYLVTNVILVALGQLGLVAALFWLPLVAGLFVLPGYVGKWLRRRQSQSSPPTSAPRRLPG